MKTALTIAGSDCSGGAGIQADIKTMLANGVYAMSAVTALTAQNTKGVTGIMEVTPEFLKEQLDNIFTDIYPDAVKIGMVSSALLIGVIAEKLPGIWGRKYCGGSDHGGNQRSQIDRGRCSCRIKREAASSGVCTDTEYSGGRAAFPNGDSDRGGYACGCEEHP